ncbi:TetR/AcrR family transcriptional regulator [Acinetobacter baumannii]|jgi:Transcriptional regulator|uniref:TetR family transcriptional regulator n=40 Tax=Acinetobacter baumannii TaxID=470 RepID=V5VAR3_ACIBA|nr:MULTISPECIES: TetR/AcrR family transcriptional regulator [Acinetobacter]ETY68610.1 TetR family transcriptional regulator [Acinetobacter baumannii MDR_MMC4]EXB13834.1 bacterial regulatory s, tetR family protein [Acinetobacter baumannii 1397084]EXC96336.1 bacterial regulatory s, tetR family protein [Acinetobacter baumannii 1051830]EYD04426.1 bacterial regulatory s, tetR family protein [Acinetobacter baumannii 44362_2]EYU50811.1 bacterial regulatory s, tetR family protein [Acinetobacter bauman
MVTIRKPKQNRAINTFDSIVGAGFISVMKNGLDHTTVLKVCEIAGVGSGSFYEYFKNKEALFVEMQQHFIAEISKVIYGVIPEILDLEIPEAIRTIFLKIGEFLAKDNNKYFYWLSVSSKYSTEASHVKAVKAINVLAIEYAMKHPEVLKIKNLKMMVYILIHSSIALTMNFFTSENMGFTFEELVDCLINITMSYIEDDRNKVA